MTRKEMLMTYTANTREHLEAQVAELQHRLRWREVDAGDCLQLQLSMERLAAFNEYTKSMFEIMNLHVDPEDVKYVTLDYNYIRYRVEKDREWIQIAPSRE